MFLVNTQIKTKGCALFSDNLMLILSEGTTSVYQLLHSAVTRYISADTRPQCVIPVTPGLHRRPTWLAIIVLFFSGRMNHIWCKLAAGIVIGKDSKLKISKHSHYQLSISRFEPSFVAIYLLFNIFDVRSGSRYCFKQ